MEPRAEAAVGVALIAAPLWVDVVRDVSLVGAAISSVCGAIIGMHAVWRLWVKYRKPS